MTETDNPFTSDELCFQEQVRRFFAEELDGKLDEYERRGHEGDDYWKAAGAAGLLGLTLPEAYGGPGRSPLYNVLLSYELGRTLGFASLGGNITVDVATTLLVNGGSEEQKRKYAPLILAGARQCMALNEIDAGSDVAAISTTARREGEDYVINGRKVYISNGYEADIIYLIAKTDPDAALRGMTMFLLDGEVAGLTRTRTKAMSFKLGGLAELMFKDVRVPASAVVGQIGGALKLLAPIMALDRLQTAARALAQTELALSLTTAYTKSRLIQGQPLFEYQNTQLRLAEIKIDIEIGTAVFHSGVRRYRQGIYDAAAAAAAKVWMTEMSARALDTCMGLFGGAGFIDETPISRLYTSNRQFRIVTGTSELLKLSIARKLAAP